MFAAHSSAVQIRSTQKEADTLIILYAVALGGLGVTIHIYSNDTDVPVLALLRVSEFRAETIIVMDTEAKRRLVKLKSIYDALGHDKAAPLPGRHALNDVGISGHIQ